MKVDALNRFPAFRYLLRQRPHLEKRLALAFFAQPAFQAEPARSWYV